MTTGEMARGMSTSASSSQAPGKRWRARMSATPTPKIVFSGTAMPATSSVSQSACSGVRRGDRIPRRAESVLKRPVEHGGHGQDDEQGEVDEHGDAQRQAPTGALHTDSERSKRRRAQPMPMSTSSEIATSTMETALAAALSSLWTRP